MLDPNAEISKLRQKLRFKNLSEFVIDQICDDAAIEISNTTSNLLADAMDDAVRAGHDAKSIDFIEQIEAIKFGSSYRIGTESGQTDFSQAPFPMLPSLLKNAKIAKDGSLYKVIPVKQKGSGNLDSKVAKTTEAAMQNINKARQAAKDAKDDNNKTYTSPNAMKGMDTVAAMQELNKFRTSSSKEKSLEPVINFRTASSKQDSNTQWVNPGRKIDMTSELNNINHNLQDNIDRAIDDIIRKFEDLY